MSTLNYKMKFVKLFSCLIPIKPLRKIFRQYFYNKYHNNKIILIDDNLKSKNVFLIKGLNISISGENNLIKITSPTKFINSSIHISGNNNYYEIGSANAKVESEIHLIGNENSIIIGNNFSFHKGKMIARGGCAIHIGNNCMFSFGITIRTCDGHAIYDLNTNDRLNYQKDVIIGDNVWLAQDVIVAKGAKIPNNCIVGARAFVNKKFSEEYSILAGCPAKVVKKNVYWEMKRDKFFKKDN